MFKVFVIELVFFLKIVGEDKIFCVFIVLEDFIKKDWLWVFVKVYVINNEMIMY